jgi:hypothetical protein
VRGCACVCTCVCNPLATAHSGKEQLTTVLPVCLGSRRFIYFRCFCLDQKHYHLNTFDEPGFLVSWVRVVNTNVKFKQMHLLKENLKQFWEQKPNLGL